MSPAIVVIYTSFLKTKGPVFIGGFGLESYARVLSRNSDAILNSFVFALIAVALISVFSGFISYIVVRRDTAVSGMMDQLMMVPYLVPCVLGNVLEWGWRDTVGPQVV